MANFLIFCMQANIEGFNFHADGKVINFLWEIRKELLFFPYQNNEKYYKFKYFIVSPKPPRNLCVFLGRIFSKFVSFLALI
jgi:hypothetical protein